MIVLTLAFFACVATQIWVHLAPSRRDAISTKVKAMAVNIAAAIRDRLFRRRMSYRALFMGENGRDMSPVGRVVLADLTKFCRGLASLAYTQTGDGHTDLYRTGVAEGRREVWLRIVKELGLDPIEVLHVVRDEDALAA